MDFNGGVPEWFKGAVLKTVVPFAGYRGFESLPLRFEKGLNGVEIVDFEMTLSGQRLAW